MSNPSPDSAIAPERINLLNDEWPQEGDYVLYWMQQSQRVDFNHALEFAIEQANGLASGTPQPLLVVFGLMDDYPDANQRHYAFMLQGLAEIAADLAKRKIRFVLANGHPADVALKVARRASVVVCDRGYLRHQKQWRQNVASEANCPVYQIESDVIVPVEAASDKREFAARTLRPKIQKQYENFRRPLKISALKKDSSNLDISALKLKEIDPTDPEKTLGSLTLNTNIERVDNWFMGGRSEALKRLKSFTANRLEEYESSRRHLTERTISELGPYLHFGQISPIEIALAVETANSSHAPKEAFIEQILVRRELAMNYSEFEPDYDRYKALPDWAKTTLAEHKSDQREHTYTLRQLELSKTHDPYWNAAMTEMRITGFMHNHLRMYWGKKILEWSKTPEAGFKTALTLNNRYFLDGRDPNSFTGVAWVFGLHDRPWTERPIFGKIRYMNDKGLERKCDMKAYLAYVDRLEGGDMFGV